MKMLEYLRDRQIVPCIADFAGRAGVSRQTVYRARAGQPLGRWAAQAISDATNGQVPVAELMGLPEARDTSLGSPKAKKKKRTQAAP